MHCTVVVSSGPAADLTNLLRPRADEHRRLEGCPQDGVSMLIHCLCFRQKAAGTAASSSFSWQASLNLTCSLCGLRLPDWQTDADILRMLQAGASNLCSSSRYTSSSSRTHQPARRGGPRTETARTELTASRRHTDSDTLTVLQAGGSNLCLSSSHSTSSSSRTGRQARRDGPQEAAREGLCQAHGPRTQGAQLEAAQNTLLCYREHCVSPVARKLVLTGACVLRMATQQAWSVLFARTSAV